MTYECLECHKSHDQSCQSPGFKSPHRLVELSSIHAAKKCMFQAFPVNELVQSNAIMMSEYRTSHCVVVDHSIMSISSSAIEAAAGAAACAPPLDACALK